VRYHFLNRHPTRVAPGMGYAEPVQAPPYTSLALASRTTVSHVLRIAPSPMLGLLGMRVIILMGAGPLQELLSRYRGLTLQNLRMFNTEANKLRRVGNGAIPSRCIAHGQNTNFSRHTVEYALGDRVIGE